MDSQTYISLRADCGCIRIFRNAIRCLGNPKYVRLSIDEKGTLLAVECYDKRSFTSFRVPKDLYSENGSMVIYSKALCSALFGKMNWDKNKTYRIPGLIYERENVAVFQLKKAVCVEF